MRSLVALDLRGCFPLVVGSGVDAAEEERGTRGEEGRGAPPILALKMGVSPVSWEVVGLLSVGRKGGGDEGKARELGAESSLLRKEEGWKDIVGYDEVWKEEEEKEELNK